METALLRINVRSVPKISTVMSVFQCVSINNNKFATV